jgi:electron transfer flavoprotein alpha subunit
MPGVLVFGEASESGLSQATLQVAAAGASVAEALGEALLGALVGADVERTATEFACGLEALYLAQGSHYEPYNAEARIAAARAIIDAASPSAVMFAHGADTRDWVPQLAARIGAGLVMDCTGISVDAGSLVVTKPVNGGGVLAEFAIRGKPALATLRTSAFQPRSGSAAARQVRVQVPPPAARPVEVLGAQSAAGSAGPRLKDAKIIVSGGRGVGGPEHWHYIEEASAALGAAVGCSRPVADSGWVPSVHQVGLSGTMVAPALYIAVGISGAAQHLAGISAARTVVAINNSADADIFFRADYGIVDDYRDVLPAFIERVKQLRS